MPSRVVRLLVVPVIAACSSAASTPDPGAAPARATAVTRGVSLEVENRNNFDANIFALHEGERRRLGLVEGRSTQTFTFPWPVGHIQFIIDFRGLTDAPIVTAVDAATDMQRCIRTAPMPIEPGESIQPLNLVLSEELDRQARASVCPR